MKLVYGILFLLLLNVIASPFQASGQTENSVYELKQKIQNFKHQPNYFNDTAYINTLINLAYLYSYTYPDSALQLLAANDGHWNTSGYKEGEVQMYMITGDAFQTKGMYDKALEKFEKAYTLAKNFNYKNAFPRIENRIGMVYLNQGNYPAALNKFYESLKAAEALQNNDLIGATLNNIAVVHYNQRDFKEAENDYKQRLKIAEQMNDTSSMSLAYNGLGEVSLQQKKLAKALEHLTTAYNLATKINDREMMLTAELSIAETYYESDSLRKAMVLFENALSLSKQMNYGTYVCNAFIGLAKVQYKQGLLKEALANGLEGLQKATSMGQVQLMRDANETVSSIYEALHDGSNALIYFKAYKVNADSINSLASERAAATEKAGYEFSKKESEFQRKALQQWWIIFSAFAALLSLVIILWLINRNRKRLNHTNKELHKKNDIIETQKLIAEKTLSELRSTQSQLIQSEKMASLGELTAGIAHEIQNPLNFVNNFSEVNKELISELVDEVDKKNFGEVKLIASDIKDNEEKINHHGKRADAIVKGMLQHSRQTSGTKEPTDINALCNEYLRLSYHGLRAKDKSFNADFKTDFDESIGKINIVPQDIGRVLLNLFNNAFYAVKPPIRRGGEEYKPLVSVTTKKIKLANNNAVTRTPSGDAAMGIEIIVSDNGSGIPSNIIDKIFQPFFTTKPTGQGTGLGLSLAYDIITKEHNGTIKAESKEGEGSLFTIYLLS